MIQEVVKGNTNKKVDENELFICSCRQEYQSFPALYLHCKTKHGISLRISEKEKMTKNTEWSGKKKRIIYELEEEYCQFSNSSHPKKAMSRDSSFEKDKSRSFFINGQDHQSSIQYHLNRFINRKVQKSQNGEKIIANQESRIIQAFMKCLDKKHAQIWEINEQTQQFTKLYSPHYIAQAFNYFILRYIPDSPETLPNEHKILACLQNLSKWLYQEQLSPYLAVVDS